MVNRLIFLYFYRIVKNFVRTCNEALSVALKLLRLGVEAGLIGKSVRPTSRLTKISV